MPKIDHKFTFSVPMSKDQQERGAQADKLRREADRLDAEIVKEVRESDICKAAQALCNHRGIRAARSGRNVSFSCVMDVTVEPTTPAPYTPPAPYIDPKVMNQLLNGKVLTEDEKRGMLKQHFPGLIADR